MGLSEIAMRAGVQKPAVSMWRTRHEDFPQPLAKLRIGYVWLWADVEAWLKKTGRPWNENWTLEQINAADRKSRKPVSWG